MDTPDSIKGRAAAIRLAIPGTLSMRSYVPPCSDLALRDPSLPTPIIDRTVQDRIGRELRGMYAELERQPIPQRLLNLLGKIAEPKGQP